MADRDRHHVADCGSVVVDKHQIAIEIIKITVAGDSHGMAVIAQ